MSQVNDGGPAFPVQSDGCLVTAGGMSLRDWFAGQVIKGLIERFPINEACDARLCEVAYKLADDMIAERNKTVSTL